MWDKLCNGFGKLVAKLTSGKYFLTICVGISFMWLVYKNQISNEAAVAIILTVMRDYFRASEEAKAKEEKA